MPGAYIIQHLFLEKFNRISLQEKDRGTYQAKVVSKAGECYSSLITIEVEPGPEWTGVTSGWIGPMANNRPCLKVSDHYGAKMTSVVSDRTNMEARHHLKFGVRSWSFPDTHTPTGWIQGTVGGWEINKSLGERKAVEEGGEAARLAESERKRLFRWILQKPYAETQEDIDQYRRESMQFAVSEGVRDALLRIWVEQEMTLPVQLEANYNALCQHLTEESEWPPRPLKKSVEKPLMGTTLNHTWDTHLEYELGLAEGWAESFEIIRAPYTIRWGSNDGGGSGFRSKHQKFKTQASASGASIQDSVSGSEAEGEDEENTESMENHDYDTLCMSVRVGEEDGSGSDTSEDKEEGGATACIERMLLNEQEDEVSIRGGLGIHMHP